MVSLMLVLLAVVPEWDLVTSNTFVRGVCSDGAGGLWCATTGGVIRFRYGEGVLETYGYPDNLPHPRTRGIALDSAGRLWVATEKGLVLIEEGETTVFTSFEGIPGTGVTYAVTEAGGYIWAGSDGGLARGEAEGFIPIEEGTVFNADRVYGLAADSDTLWLATDRGVFSLDLGLSPFDPSAWKGWESTAGLALRGVEVTSLGVCAYGSSGLTIRSPGYEDFRLILNYTSSDTTVTGAAVLDGMLVAARNGAVLQFKEDRWEVLAPPIPIDVTPSFLENVDGNLWMGYGVANPQMEVAGRGILLRQGGAWLGTTLPGMQCMSIYQIARDPSGRMYTGTYIRGLQACYPGWGWRVFTADNSGFPNSQQVFAAATWAGQGVWASSYHFGLTWVDDNGTPESGDDRMLTFFADSIENPVPPSTILVPSGLVNNQVTMLASQGPGVWSSHREYFESTSESSGITGFSGDPGSLQMQWAVRTPSEGLALKNVRGVFPQGTDSLWIAFLNSGGCQLLVHSGDPSDPSGDSWHPGIGQAYTISSGLPSNDVFCILPVSGRGVYAGTASGLARFTPEGFVSVPGIDGQIKAMAADAAGRIWCLGTSGVFCLEGNQVYWFDQSNSDFLQSSRVDQEYALFLPDSGAVLFSSQIGMWSISSQGGSGVGDLPVFYPQPYLPGQGSLLLGIEGDGPVRVEFYGVDGAFLEAVEAESPSQWSWDGEFNRARAASGVYMVLVRTGGRIFPGRIAVVR